MTDTGPDSDSGGRRSRYGQVARAAGGIAEAGGGHGHDQRFGSGLERGSFGVDRLADDRPESIGYSVPPSAGSSMARGTPGMQVTPAGFGGSGSGSGATFGSSAGLGPDRSRESLSSRYRRTSGGDFPGHGSGSHVSGATRL